MKCVFYIEYSSIKHKTYNNYVNILCLMESHIDTNFEILSESLV